MEATGVGVKMMRKSWEDMISVNVIMELLFSIFIKKVFFLIFNELFFLEKNISKSFEKPHMGK